MLFVYRIERSHTVLFLIYNFIRYNPTVKCSLSAYEDNLYFSCIDIDLWKNYCKINNIKYEVLY